MIDKLFVEYSYRYLASMGSIKLGTITTFKGVFDRTLNSTKRIPMIYLPSGVYNDEWMSGFLDTVVGGSVEQSAMIGGTLLTATVVSGEPRVTDNAKMEAGGFNYESTLSDIDLDDNFYSTTIKVEYMDTIELFTSSAHGGFTIVDVSNMTYNEKLMYVYLNGDDYDRSILLSGNHFTYEINRIGGVLRLGDATITYEEFKMHLVTEGYTKDSHGNYVYANYSIGNYTPYIAVSKSISSHKATERVYGVKYDMSDSITLLAEYRVSDWVQTRDINEYIEWKYDGRPKAKVVLLELLKTW
jgi:hypothetical protein